MSGRVILSLFAILGIAVLISCSDGGTTGPVYESIDLFPGEAIVGLGAEVAYQVNVVEQGDTLPVPPRAVRWSSSDPSVVSASGGGIAIANQLGEAWIIATAGGARDSARISVVVCPNVQKADEPFGPREPLPPFSVIDTLAADSLMSLIRRNNGRVVVGFREPGSSSPPETAWRDVRDETYEESREKLIDLGLNICLDLRSIAAVAVEIPPIMLDRALITTIRTLPTTSYFEVDFPAFPIEHRAPRRAD